MQVQLFIRKCAWCQRELGPRTTTMVPGDQPAVLVTHGICESCKRATLAGVGTDHEVLTAHSDGPETVQTLWGEFVVGGEG